MTDSSRKIQLETGVDASGAKAGFQQVKDAAKDMATSVAQSGQEASKGVDGISDGAKKAADSFTREEGRLAASIRRSTLELKTLGKTASEKIETKIDFLGLDGAKFQPLLEQLRAAEAQAKVTAAALQSVGAPATSAAPGAKFGAAANDVDVYTKSVKQMSMQHQIAAVQVKDFIEQVLAGGSPLRAFAMQGAAVVSNYGGVGATLKALGGLLTPLNVSLGLAAVTVGTLAVAMHEGSQESVAYAKALILTGNSIGKTTDQLKEMAAGIAKTTGTQGDAAEALASMAKSGKIATSAFSEVGAAAVSMNRVLGVSIDEAVATFAKLADEPTKASAKLNESMHYLNLATYERIRALEEQGQKEEAAALAQKTLADATNTRLAAVEQQAGVLARAWRALAHDAKEAWDMMAGLGRPQTTGEKLADMQKLLAERQQRGPLNSTTGAAFDKGNAKLQADIAALSRQALREQDNAYAEGEKARTAAAQIGASDRLKILNKEIESNADKRKKAKEDLARDFKTLDKSTDSDEFRALSAKIDEKFKDPKGAAVKAFQDDAATKLLENLRQQEASLKEQLNTDQKLTDAERERAKFTQLIADLKTKGTLTAEQKSLLANKDMLQTAYDHNAELSRQVENKKESAKLDKEAEERAKSLANTFEGINVSLESANQGRRDQYERMLSTVGLGQRARQQADAQRSIREEARRAEASATKSASKLTDRDGVSLLYSQGYKDEVASIHASLEESLADLRDYYEKDAANRKDWVNGAREAFANYADEASDAAKHTEEAFGNAFKGIEDQFVNLFTGKKVDLKGLFDSITTDLTRNFVKEQITGPLAKFAGDALGDGGMFSGLLGTSKKGGNERGSNASNPLYVRMADSFGTAANSSSFGSGGGSGSGLASLIGSISGGLSNGAATGVANALPGDSLDNLIKLTGGWGTIGAFANGGDPPVGRVSIVGERGPELFVPKQAGTIIPNGALGGGTVVHIHQSFPENTNRKTVDQAAMQAGNAVRRAQRNA